MNWSLIGRGRIVGVRKRERADRSRLRFGRIKGSGFVFDVQDSFRTRRTTADPLILPVDAERVDSLIAMISPFVLLSARRLAFFLGSLTFPRFALKTVATMAVVVTLVSSDVLAAPIVFKFSGVLTQVSTPGIEPPAMVQFYAGQRFWGRFTYDPTVPDAWPDDSLRGYYPQDTTTGASGLEFYVGDDFFRTDPSEDFAILIRNDIPEGTLLEPTGDSLTFRGGLADTSLAGDTPLLSLRSWHDPNALAFKSDALPSSFAIADFDPIELEASVIRTPLPFLTQIVLRGTVDNIEVVPEPRSIETAVTGTVVAIGFVAITLRRRRRLKTRS